MNSSCEAKSDASKVPESAGTPARALTSSATRRASSASRAARYRSRAIGREPDRERARDRTGGAKNQNSIHFPQAGRKFRHPQPARQGRRETVVGIGDAPSPPATSRSSDTSRETSQATCARPWPGTRARRASAPSHRACREIRAARRSPGSRARACSRASGTTAGRPARRTSSAPSETMRGGCA